MEAAASSSSKQEILIVEDDEAIAAFQKMYFQKAGFAVTVVGTGADAIQRATGGVPPALVVLDLGLPDMEGIEVCRRLRAQSDLPIIIVTARDEEIDKVVGLELGADDYVAKPFQPKELVARVRAILRRVNPDKNAKAQQRLSYGPLTIDAGRREVKVGGQNVALSPKEFDLLWELLVQQGYVLKRDQLLQQVWGYANPVDTRTVDVHVRQLRQKLGDAVTITTVWGVGYKIAPENEEADN